MADGIDRLSNSEAFTVRTGVRAGFKREFQFAVKAQAEAEASLESRTRERKPPSLYTPASPPHVPSRRSSGKKPATSDGQSWSRKRGRPRRAGPIPPPPPPEASMNPVEPMAREGGGEPSTAPVVDGGVIGDIAVGSSEVSKNSAVKKSKKTITKIPSNIRELLATGLLNGLTVTYKANKIAELDGRVMDGKIWCNCSICQGSTPVSACDFEKHAGSLKKHPADFICLENGKTIRDVLDACKGSPLDILDRSILNAISSRPTSYNSTSQKCKESFHTSHTGKSTSICASSQEPSQSQTTQSSRHTCTSVRDSQQHKLLRTSHILFDGAEVASFVHEKCQDKHKGLKEETGISSSCCESVVTRKSEAHACAARRHKTYKVASKNISGSSEEQSGVAITVGKDAGVNLVQEFNKCIQIIRTPEIDLDCCVICRQKDYDQSDSGPRTMLLCDQCDREYHLGCLKDHNMGDLKGIPEGEWFCSTDCNRIYAALQDQILHEAVPVTGVALEIIKRKITENQSNRYPNLDIRWRLLSGKTSSADSKLFLSSIVSIFHESFHPIIGDDKERDLIPDMVNGDLEFRGMYSAVLTVGSSIVSALILRILDCEVAEFPLVATSRQNQQKGYFQALFHCVERFTEFLNIKHIILPATKEAESFWIKKFGFTKVKPNQLLAYTKGAHMTFRGTSMLCKPVPKSFEGIGKTDYI